jgi:adenylate cyclase, class 2
MVNHMGTEIEKKYRLTREQHAELLRRLREMGARAEGEEFEENTIYAGHGLDPRRNVLRLRRVGRRATLTYKERFETSSAIKHQREDETRVEDAEALKAILDGLGYRPALVYEKRRLTWRIKGAEVVVDELPFGLFLEIEGEEKSIIEVERLLGLTEAEAEMASYPELTQRHGEKRGDVIEARFPTALS